MTGAAEIAAQSEELAAESIRSSKQRRLNDGSKASATAEKATPVDADVQE